MTIILTRIVPLEGALIAVSETLDAADREDPVAAADQETFMDWFHEPRFGMHRGLIDAPCLTLDQAREAVATVPNVAAGRAWADKVNASIAKTLRDTARPYDQIDPSGHPSYRALDALASDIQDNGSRLLEPVVDGIQWLINPEDQTIGGYRESLARARATGLNVANPYGGCDKHEECTGQNVDEVPWTDIDLLRPGTAQEILRLAAELTAALPDDTAFDNGAARR